jgi:hypothetical protein
VDLSLPEARGTQPFGTTDGLNHPGAGAEIRHKRTDMKNPGAARSGVRAAPGFTETIDRLPTGVTTIQTGKL